MKKEFDKDRTNLINKRVFYISLSICVVAIAIALYIGISSTMEELGKNDTVNLPQTSTTLPVDQQEDVGVNKSLSDVPVLEPQTNQPKEASGSTKSKTTDEKKEQKNNTPHFKRPLEGEIIHPFSKGELVKSKTLNEWRTHDGVDIKAEAGTPVKAIADGKIENITEDTMWGVCVVISHDNNYQSMYFGLKPNVPVKKGASIKVGEMIGHVGNTAEIEIAEPSHLHFSIKKEDKWIDPMSVIK